MSKLGEIKVYGLNERWTSSGPGHQGAEDEYTALELMQEIYKSILHNDSMWHFFWEGDYTVIRCQFQYLSVVKQLLEGWNKTLDEHSKLEIVEKQLGYQENIPVTKKYIEAYVPIFHGYSVLAMEMDNEDFIEILERNNHCFLNMVTRYDLVEQYRIPGDKYDTHDGMGWEAIVLSHVANLRMYTCGWLYGLIEGKKRQDGKQKD